MPFYKKKNPKTHSRTNLKKLVQTELTARFRTLKKKTWKSSRRGHLFFNNPLPNGFKYSNNGHRPICNVTEMVNKKTRKNKGVCATALALYFEPTRCHTVLPTGDVCRKRHRTPYNYSKHHPETSPNDVHLSHICHHAECVNRRHLIFEPYSVNLHRNTCRLECSCGASPKCFTEIN